MVSAVLGYRPVSSRLSQMAPEQLLSISSSYSFMHDDNEVDNFDKQVRGFLDKHLIRDKPQYRGPMGTHTLTIV